MQTLGINEKFILSFLISKNDADLYDRIMMKLTKSYSIAPFSKAPAMFEITTETIHLRAAVALIDGINTCLAMIEEVKKDWNMGLLTKDEYNTSLSKYMVLVAK